MGKDMQNVPKLRFRGFDEDWQQNRLEELFVFLQNNTLSRAELKQELGIARNVHYGDVLIRYGEVTRVDELVPEYISNPDIAERFKLSLLSDGDIVFADTAEDETAGRCTEISETEGLKVISGLHTIPCHPLEKFAYGFIGFCLNASSFHNQLLPLMQGAKVTSISKTALASAIVRYPKEKDEQKLVGNTLMSVNNLITLHQRKLSKLQDLKKALLVKMFPAERENVPAVRFKGYEDAWEQHKLGDVATEFIAGGDIDVKKIKEEGLYPVCANALTENGIVGYYSDRYRVIGPAVTITGRGDVGHAVARKYNFTPVVRLISVKSNVDVDFLSEAINKSKITVESTGVPQLTIPQASNIVIFLSSSDKECAIIGNLFQKIDTLITLHQRKLNKLKDIKKALLNNMFPGGDI